VHLAFHVGGSIPDGTLPSKCRHVSLAAISILVAACLSAYGWAAEPLVRSGASIAFLGDSITYQGARTPSGFVNLVISGLKANRIRATAIPAGVGGDKSDQMLERLAGDVLSKKPDWMVLSCGVNDVALLAKGNGTPIDAYKANITAIVDRATAAGVKVVILTATMITEDPNERRNKALAPYNDFLRELAAKRKLPLADLNADMCAGLNAVGDARKSGSVFTVDGIHMNPAGNQMMALGVLGAFGLNKAQIAKAKTAWPDIHKHP
jgi:lysophospholipase L1-like esterase